MVLIEEAKEIIASLDAHKKNVIAKLLKRVEEYSMILDLKYKKDLKMKAIDAIGSIATLRDGSTAIIRDVEIGLEGEFTAHLDNGETVNSCDIIDLDRYI